MTRQRNGARRAQVLTVLAGGPRTTSEVATALSVERVPAGMMLRYYAKLGTVASGPVLEGQPARGNRSELLWTLGTVPPKPRGKYTSTAARLKDRERAPRTKAAKVQRAAAVPKPVAPTPQTAAAARLNAQAWATATEKALPAAKAGDAESIEQFQRRGGRVEVLPPTQYIPAPQQPVGWKT